MLGDKAYDSAELRDLSVAKPFLIPLTRQEAALGQRTGHGERRARTLPTEDLLERRQQLFLGDPGGVRRLIYRSKTI
jgi:hypothetical protein